MAINVDRIRGDIEAIGRCTATPGHGATRSTFSAAWAKARDYIVEQANLIDCELVEDYGGNLHARPGGLGWDTPAWLVGSHIDTVPHGGNFDGVAGVVVGLELLRSAHEDGMGAAPIELIVFAEEEGPTFGLGMLGARTWLKELSIEELSQLRNADGQNYIEAGRPFCVLEEGPPPPNQMPNRYLGLLELHIEQGPGMWRRDQRLAVVSAIAGRRQYRVAVEGHANHAGATAMNDRKDALAAAADAIVGLERLASGIGPSAVITVGRLDVSPNVVNVIADRVEFTIDFRSPDDIELDRGDRQIRALIQGVGGRRGVATALSQTESIPARPMNAELVNRVSRVATLAGFANLPIVVSGALHDSAILAPHLPTVMLFVPSRDGISHNPAEFSRVEDIAAGATVIERLVRQPTLQSLNGMSSRDFVAAIGSAFEHSAWISERTRQTGRPFASLADLHDKLCGAVRRASLDEQVKLIQAHPDLVGRLAREGRLTRESAAEQSAAGLASLTADEVAGFERYNAAYRDRFGFPFVICARENKKDAILAAFPRRLENSRDQEIATALEEIYKIARLRLADAIWEK